MLLVDEADEPVGVDVRVMHAEPTLRELQSEPPEGAMPLSTASATRTHRAVADRAEKWAG